MSDDNTIIELYFARSEDALIETDAKFGGLCRKIAINILLDPQDCEECVNDTWLTAWNKIPPQRPNFLGAFLAKITRNLSLNRLRKRNTDMRKANELSLCIEELSECISNRADDSFTDDIELRDILDRFLSTLSKDARWIFLRRYWYVSSVEQIGAELNMEEGAVKMSLSRTRKKLKKYLEEEGISI